MNELKKNDLIKTRILCNTFRFINDLNSINDGGEFGSNFSNIYPQELKLSKENTDIHEASFLDLAIKKTAGKFHFEPFYKRDSLPFSTVRIPDKSSNVPSSKVHFAISAESLRIARASNNPESFSTANKANIFIQHFIRKCLTSMLDGLRGLKTRFFMHIFKKNVG